MPQARGANAKLRGAFESVWGTPPVSGFFDLPFKSLNLGGAQPLERDTIMGQGRDQAAPMYGDIDVSGNIVVPLDVRNIGTWLKLALGAPTTTGSGPYTHTFNSGAPALPFMSLEVGNPDVSDYTMNKGVLCNSIQIPFLSGSGFPDVTLDLIGQDEATAGSSAAGTPTARAFARYNRYQGQIKKDGSVLGAITAATLTYANGLDATRYVSGSPLIGDLDPAECTLSGTLTGRFKDSAIRDAAIAETPAQLDFVYTIDTNTSLVVTAYEVYFSRPKKNIQGAGGIEIQLDWSAAKNITAGKMMRAVLKNDVSSY